LIACPSLPLSQPNKPPRRAGLLYNAAGGILWAAVVSGAPTCWEPPCTGVGTVVGGVLLVIVVATLVFYLR
jgi:hypothetical protein